MPLVLQESLDNNIKLLSWRHSVKAKKMPIQSQDSDVPYVDFIYRIWMLETRSDTHQFQYSQVDEKFVNMSIELIKTVRVLSCIIKVIGKYHSW